MKLKIEIDLTIFTGCVWIYGTYEPDYSYPTSANYCNYALYMFAFWVVNSMIIFGVIALLIFICMAATSFSEE